MEVKIGSKRFRLHVTDKPEAADEPSDGSQHEGVYVEKAIYHSEGELSPLIITSAFYNACLRWATHENISKRLIYEFLVCLTGETQISRLLKRTACSQETHASVFRHYVFWIYVFDENLPYDAIPPPKQVDIIGSPTRQERLKLAEIQLKLLSKLS